MKKPKKDDLRKGGRKRGKTLYPHKIFWGSISGSFSIQSAIRTNAQDEKQAEVRKKVDQKSSQKRTLKKSSEVARKATKREPKGRPKSLFFPVFSKKAESHETVCFPIENMVPGMQKQRKSRSEKSRKSRPEKRGAPGREKRGKGSQTGGRDPPEMAERPAWGAAGRRNERKSLKKEMPKKRSEKR